MVWCIWHRKYSKVLFSSTCALLHDLAQDMLILCACVFYFYCLLIPKTSCSRHRSTLCAAFNRSGPKSLNSSEAHKVSCTADYICLYVRSDREENHTIFFLFFFFQCFACHCIFISFLVLSFQNSSPVLSSVDEVTSQSQQSLLSMLIEERLDLADSSD